MKWWISSGMVVAVAALLAASGVPTKVHYVSGDRVSAAMVKGEQIVTDEGLVIIANRRGAAEAEMHDATNHVFIIVEVRRRSSPAAR